jgi:hypothetical protein
MDVLTPYIKHARLRVRTLLDIKRSPFRLPWKRAFRAWRHGFTEWSYLLYNLDVEDPQHFLSDRDYTLYGHRVLARRMELLVDKWNAGILMDRVGIPQPETFGRLGKGVFRPGRRFSRKSLLELLAENERLVVKPSYGAGGWGILFLDQHGDEVRVNGVSTTSEHLDLILGSCEDAIVTSFATQAEYAKAVFPATTNTLRILILWDDVEEAPFVAAAAHRFGMNRSSLIDNFHGGHGGGLSAPISSDGILGKGMNLSETGERTFFSHHPDTGKPIEGLVVPGWHKVVAELLESVGKIPLLTKAIGWDLVKTENGWVCIEANPGPGIKVWQAHGGLLADPRSRRFYEECGVV